MWSLLWLLPLRLVAQAQTTPAYFLFDSPPSPATFVIKLQNPATIQMARANLQNPNFHLGGTLSLSPAWYNPAWSYHLIPESIYFFEAAIEVCDASMEYIEQNLDAVGSSFLPNFGWCPWQSRLLQEVYPTNLDLDNDFDLDAIDLFGHLHSPSLSIFTYNQILFAF